MRGQAVVRMVNHLMRAGSNQNGKLAVMWTDSSQNGKPADAWTDSSQPGKPAVA